MKDIIDVCFLLSMRGVAISFTILKKEKRQNKEDFLEPIILVSVVLWLGDFFIHEQDILYFYLLLKILIFAIDTHESRQLTFCYCAEIRCCSAEHKKVNFPVSFTFSLGFYGMEFPVKFLLLFWDIVRSPWARPFVVHFNAITCYRVLTYIEI